VLVYRCIMGNIMMTWNKLTWRMSNVLKLKLDIDRESHGYKNGGKRSSRPVAVYRSHDRAENKPANQSAAWQWKWRAGKTHSDWLAYLRLGHVTYIPLWPWPDFFHVCRASTPYYPGRLGPFVWAASSSVNCHWYLPASSSFNPSTGACLDMAS